MSDTNARQPVSFETEEQRRLWRHAYRAVTLTAYATVGVLVWVAAVILTRGPGESPKAAGDRAGGEWPSGPILWLLLAVLLGSALYGGRQALRTISRPQHKETP